ncbi:MAG TPA: Verru_Chthon cassette protein B [Candidatus Methylacidiphilales bacterium]
MNRASLPGPPCRAFSLVELLFALGIVCFALIPLLGLVPIGLSSFRQAMDINAKALIFQALASESQLLDYTSVTNAGSTYSQSFPRYYDGTGVRLDASDPGAAFKVSMDHAACAVPGGTASAQTAQRVSFSLARKNGREKASLYFVLVVNNGS